MTHASDPLHDNPPAWDLSVLRTPTVLTIPAQVPDNPDPLLISTLETLVASLLNEDSASERIGALAHTGVVALRTSSGTLEIHETLLGWTLARTWGQPDPTDLAAAAQIRAHRLAAERRHGHGDLP